MEDKCWTTVVLPDYPISRIRTGQYTKSGRIWEIDLSANSLTPTPYRQNAGMEMM